MRAKVYTFLLATLLPLSAIAQQNAHQAGLCRSTVTALGIASDKPEKSRYFKVRTYILDIYSNYMPGAWILEYNRAAQNNAQMVVGMAVHGEYDSVMSYYNKICDSLIKQELLSLKSLSPAYYEKFKSEYNLQEELSSMRCGEQLVSKGDLQVDVARKCGKPVGRYEVGQEIDGHGESETWFYNQYNGVQYVLRFSNGKLFRIQNNMN